MTSAWTNVAKPTETTTNSGGSGAEAFGLLIAITSVTGSQITSIITGWTEVSKPTSSVWTLVIKPTS